MCITLAFLSPAKASFSERRVAAKISAEVTVPFEDRKFEGIFSISTELSPMASPAFEVGRPTTTETMLSRILEKTIRRSAALDTESLCLIAGQKCFAVRADVHILANDGNLLDASSIAVVAALSHFRRPDVSVEGEKVTVWDGREREPIKLSMLHCPFCVSFNYFHGGEVVLVDATAQEEKVRGGEYFVSVNRFGECCQMAKLGGVTVDAEDLLRWIKIATEKVRQIDGLVHQRLKEDERRRDVGGLIAELSAENER